MKQILICLLCVIGLTACSSTSVWNNSFGGRFNRTTESVSLTGGRYEEDSKAFYWYTQKMSQPETASDYVTFSDKTWYKSTYRWQKGIIHEIVREGKTRQSSIQPIQPFLIHIRFNSEGEAVYQRYRINEQIFPIHQAEITQYIDDAETLIEYVEAAYSDDVELIQGIWNGEVFEDCQGFQYENAQLEELSLPSIVAERLNSLSSYVAFLGKRERTTKMVKIDTLLALEKSSHACVQRPNLSLD